MSDLPAAVGRYRVERLLGRGAMGMIYLAHDPVIDRKVAIKLIRADLLSGDDRAEYLERFQHEARAAGRCSHPNIVAIYDYAVHEGNPFLAMEYVEGSTLSQALTRVHRFSPTDAVALVSQVLDALACAHGLGVVHRDVKPANILVLADHHVKMTDFGISRIATSALTQVGAIIGTPSYMSPEQCRGDPVDARSDLFSAAVVLYQLLSGAQPFTGAGATEVALQIVQREPPDIRSLVPSLPDALVAAIDRGLAKSPDDRFTTAKDMADALRRSVTQTAEPTVLLRSAVATPRHEATTSRGITPVVVQNGEHELAVHIGPIARILAKRASEAATSPEDFWHRLAAHIEHPADRQAFLSRRRS